MKINVINKSKHELPEYSAEALAGMNMRANLEKEYDRWLLLKMNKLNGKA
jgi:hypothetical protein